MNESPPAPLDELISRHFDEVLSPEEHGQLTAALTTDPHTGRVFASTALLHARLEALAPPLSPPVRKRSILRWLATGAAAASFAVGTGFLLTHLRVGSGVKITLEAMDAAPDSQTSKSKAPALTKRIVKAPASAQPAGTVLDIKQMLSKYYVNVTPHGLSVSQALAQLEKAIQFENVFNRPELDQLTFTPTTSFDPESADPMVYTPEQAPMTVTRYLETCSAYRQVVQHPGSVTIGPERVPVTLAAMMAAPEVRDFRVSSYLLVSLAKKDYSYEGPSTEMKLAADFGIRFDKEESATFSSNPPTVTVSAAPGKLEQLTMRMKLALERNPIQFFITSKLVKLRRSLLPPGFKEESGLIMADPDSQKFFTELSRKATGSVLYCAPSTILRRMGQKCLIETTKEIGGAKAARQKVGLSQEILATATGELFRVEGSIDIGLMEGVGMPGELDLLGLVSKGGTGFQSWKTEYEVWLPDRSTALFLVDAPQPEDYVTLACLTATAIDPAGAPVPKVDDDGVPVGTSVQGKPGFIYSPFVPDQKMIDVTGIPAGAKVKCPFSGKELLVP